MSLELQFKELRLLWLNPHLIQRELSKFLGVGSGVINNCLMLLWQMIGQIQNFKNNKNKWVYTGLLMPQGFAKNRFNGNFLEA